MHDIKKLDNNRGDGAGGLTSFQEEAMKRLLYSLPLIAVFVVPGLVQASNSATWYQNITDCYRGGDDACQFSSFDSSGTQTENMDIRAAGVDIHSAEVMELRKDGTGVSISPGDSDIAGISVEPGNVNVKAPPPPPNGVKRAAAESTGTNHMYATVYFDGTGYSNFEVETKWWGTWGSPQQTARYITDIRREVDETRIEFRYQYRFQQSGSWRGWTEYRSITGQDEIWNKKSSHRGRTYWGYTWFAPGDHSDVVKNGSIPSNATAMQVRFLVYNAQGRTCTTRDDCDGNRWGSPAVRRTIAVTAFP